MKFLVTYRRYAHETRFPASCPNGPALDRWTVDTEAEGHESAADQAVWDDEFGIDADWTVEEVAA